MRWALDELIEFPRREMIASVALPWAGWADFCSSIGLTQDCPGELFYRGVLVRPETVPDMSVTFTAGPRSQG